MNVLVIDVGGTNVKLLATGKKERRRFASGQTLTARQMVAGVKKVTEDWPFDAVSIGFPGRVVNNSPVAEPVNLGKGWVGFDFRKAFGCPVKIINDAAMQALGSYRGGTMLFLGLGTGLGTAMVSDGVIVPMEAGHLPYKKKTFEDYVGLRGYEKMGKKRWRKHVADVVKVLSAALCATDVVLGGGQTANLKLLPEGCRIVDNNNAFTGGFRLWKDAKNRS